MISNTNHHNRERGFTLIELAVATVVLLIGVVAVMQLVPAAIQSNLNNRYDTTAAVTTQRLLDLMVNSGVNPTTLTDPTGTFPCGGAAITCNLGDGTQTQWGNELTLNNTQIDFTSGRIPGFNFMFVDPNDPTNTRYDIRWAVIVTTGNVGQQTNVILSKRFIVGARRIGRQPPTSVTMTAWVSR